MKDRILERKTILNKPIETVFDFFGKAENLNSITPAELNFEIITQGNSKIKEGTIIDYKINIYGFKVKWKTLITCFEPPNLFIDKQVKGPYSKWIHYHTFYPEENSKTVMHDKVIFRVPGLIFEPIIFQLFVKKKLNNIFDFRQKVCEEIFHN